MVNAQPTLWETLLPQACLGLPAEPAAVDPAAVERLNEALLAKGVAKLATTVRRVKAAGPTRTVSARFSPLPLPPRRRLRTGQ